MDVLEISVPEFEAKAGKEESIFQDLHVVFKIVVRTTGNGADGSQSTTTYRRYREFDLLRNYLTAAHPEIVIPPIPIKKMNFTWESMGLDPFETAFLEERMAGLEVFLERVSVHPKLRSDDVFINFLSDDKRFMEKTNGTKFAEMADSRLKSSIASLRIKKMDRLFAETLRYSESLDMSTRAAKGQVKCLCDGQASMNNRYESLGMAFSAWAEDDEDIPVQLAATGGQLATMAESTRECVGAVEQKYILPLQEYCLYGSSVRSVARHQLLLQYDLEQTEEALSNKGGAKLELANEREDQITFGRIAARVLTGDTSKSARLHAIQRDMDALEASSQAQIVQLGAFTASAMKELDVFHAQKSADLRAYWKAFIRQQIVMNTKAISCWHAVRSSFEDVKN